MLTRQASRMMAAGLLVAIPAFSSAQRQPADATNSQDESVVINKTLAEDANLLKIFRSGDKAEFNHYTSQVIELHYASPFEVVPHVKRAVEKEKGSVRTLAYQDPETGKERSFVQIVTTPEQMQSVIDSIRAIDLPGVTSSEGDLKYNYRLKYRRASEVADIIAATTGTTDLKVGFDDITNSIFISDSPSDTKREFFTIQYYDVPPPQIEFEVMALEFDNDDSSKLGVDWDAWKSAVGGQIEITANQFEGGDSFWRIDSLLTVDAQAVANFLSYTTQTGTAKVVTRSTITASNDIPGTVSSLKRVATPVYTVVASAASELLEDTPGVDARSEEDVDTISKRPVVINPSTRSFLGEATSGSEGIALSILPVIGTEMVTASVGLTVNSLSGTTPAGAPIISERKANTVVTLKDGEAFLLGGIDRETAVNVRRGIPGLKSIPVLKYLFSVESEIQRHARLYVVITPRFKNQLEYTEPLIIGTKFAEVPPFDGYVENPDTVAAPVEELDER